MKFIFNVLIVLLALYGGYMLYENYLKPPPPPPPPPPPVEAARQPQIKTIVCKLCQGRGRLVDTSMGVQNGYRCPICNGLGKKTYPVDAKNCDYCDGWGKVPRPKKNAEGRLWADKCPICGQLSSQ